MVKRGVDHRSASSVKRMKKSDPIAEKCEEVVRAINRISDLPEAVKELFGEMLPFSLTVCREDRHEFQVRIIEALAVELDKVEKRLQATARECTEKVNGLSTQKGAREEAVTSAEAAHGEKEASVNEHKHALAHDCLAFRAAREAHSEAQATQMSGDQELLAAEDKKERLREAFEGTFRPLKNGSEGTSETLKKATDLVGCLCALYPVDDSLATALPSALSKEPSARSTFDTMAVNEVETCIEKRMQEIDTLIQGGAQGKSERAEAVQAAAEGFEAAKKQLCVSCDAYKVADAEKQECSEAITNAKKASRQLATEQRRADKALSNASHKLEAFQQGPNTVFQELRNRSAEKLVDVQQELEEEVEGEPAATTATAVAEVERAEDE